MSRSVDVKTHLKAAANIDKLYANAIDVKEYKDIKTEKRLYTIEAIDIEIKK